MLGFGRRFRRRGGLDARLLYLILAGASSFCFALVFTVNLVYQVETAGLSPLHLVLVGTVLEAVIFVCEVPTGVVADVYSRRLSVTIGVFLIGLGFLVEGAFPVFAAILLAQVIWGIGETFTSGAREAWIADEVGPERVGAVYLRGAQAGQLGAVLGIGASVALASVRLNLPILAGGALFLLLGAFLVVAMPELGFRPAPREDRSSRQAMGATLRDGARLVRGRPALVSILAVGAVAGMASEGFDRLWTVHLLETVGLPGLGRLDPVVWFGLIGVGSMLIGIAATEALRRRIDTADQRVVARALLAINAGLVVAVVAFGLAGSFAAALTAFWVATLLRDLSGPLHAAWLNQHVEARVRATVLSMGNQLNALGQIAGGPAIGAVGNASVRVALVISGLLLAPALPLVARAARQGDGTPVVGEEVGATVEP